jgi:hypothetical protein
VSSAVAAANWSGKNFLIFPSIFTEKKNFFSSQEINYDSPRGGVSVITEKGDVTTSYLLIQRARSGDSGQYTCSPSNANPKTVQVHILKGLSARRLIKICYDSSTSTLVELCFCRSISVERILARHIEAKQD